jgi:hypothetical protein
MRRHIAPAILIGLSAVVSQAHARSNWSMVGAACTPDPTAIAANRYTVTGGSVVHKLPAAGLIILYCPITKAWDDSHKPDYYAMTWENTNSRFVDVTAQLIRVSRCCGTAPLNVVHCCIEGHDTSGSISISRNFNHDFDFRNNYYYIRVDIDRKPDAPPDAFGKLFGVVVDKSGD